MDFYAGLDLSLEATNICVVDGEGKVVREAKLETDPDAIELFLGEWGIQLKRVGLEAFSYSAWLFTALSEKGLPVICIETRHAKAALNAMLNKTERNDAKGIAQMMRTSWFRAVHVKSEAAQTLRALLVGRKAMLGKVLDMENMIRGLLRPFGLKVGEIPVGRFDTRVRDLLAVKKELEAIVTPLFDARNAMRLQLAKLHRLALTAARSDSAVRRMMMVPGVGALVALTFRATVDDPTRFGKSTNVGAHFGLTPRRYQSGQTDRIGSIAKCGDELTRAMLYEAAIAILTRIPKHFKLRLGGLRLARKKGLKRAATAVARALAVLLHKIWIDGTTFRFGAGKRGRVAAAV
ncbi:IS110 family transposase [Bradyrhizobium sp. 156]|uniref:IS110 family transposase n=1 Tax=unclassified Bradyrhizobium TaxID=2631580 RepID=UPI001FFB559B|nr:MULTISPECIES: IS110 family transposase [unclassified Bradyrhizobium]MCK1325388.1 IS110 family transposase [Bradyrhizobium sp. 156]MCK1418094.1 IS110 family transposase [Bradyrhizobium sp. CW4]